MLDHCHTTGAIRDVLCRNCNGMEGKIKGIATRAKGVLTQLEWLRNLVAYLDRHQQPQHGGIMHPTHKTEAEKRLERAKRAKAKRAALKATRNK